MSDLDIFVPVSAQSLPYYEYLVKNYRTLASGKFKLNFFALAMDPGLRVSEGELLEIGHGRGSGGHAIAFQEALRRPWGTSYVRVIADSDTVMLARDWDVTLLSLMFPMVNNDGAQLYDVIGTTYEPIGGFSSGDGLVQTYKDRPNATWIAISGVTAVHEAFAAGTYGPVKAEHLLIDSEEMSQRYRLPVGNRLLRDVGWQIPEIIDRNGFKDLGLRHVKPTGEARAIKTGNGYHEEYQLPDGSPFVGHQRGSMKHPFRGNDISSTFYSAVEAYLANL